MMYGDDIVGQTVWVEWEEGRGQTAWYEAVVESYDPSAGTHLLVYPADGMQVNTNVGEFEEAGILLWEAPKKTSAAPKRAGGKIRGNPPTSASEVSRGKSPAKRTKRAMSLKEDEEEEAEVHGAEAAAVDTGAPSSFEEQSDESDGYVNEGKRAGRKRKEAPARPREGERAGRKRKELPAKPAPKGKALAKAPEKKPVGTTMFAQAFSKPAVSGVKAQARKRPPKQASQPFVDPAGLDIEDRGVEWIVEAQVEKLLPLIEDALAHGEMGGLSMATACSGTDAPVVAMRVVQEMLERYGLRFDFQHVMSCELEPYKQSFIARNNPGVLLFPDIRLIGQAKQGTKATTVYGGLAEVPGADMIVAGTSCKDFSNLKGHDRKSIEAMGTSGETFIGFVDLLMEQAYASAILENVQGAEWEKMAHYITGVLPLYSLKPNKSANRTAPQELAFVVEGKALVVSEVSEFAGVRLGAVLIGHASVGAEDSKVIPITSEGYKGRVGVTALAQDYGLDGSDSLVFHSPVTYRTQLLDMDAKEFGLPQTRQRKYMFIWRPDKFPSGVDIAQLWVELVDFLRVPLKYSVDSFLLSDENDRIHRFRDALRGPLGRLTAMERQSGDWWGENANRDTQHTKDFRACAQGWGGGSSNSLKSPAEEMHRPFTNWGPNGKLSLASAKWWPEYLSVISQRELDLCDCFGICAAEKGYDTLHHSMWWNISQNVGRTDVIPRAGITGCITPGGENFGPHMGRCILGYEKLLLGGIPVDKLLLGTETEVQLADLAGNAMAMPVVSAAILGALLVPAYARQSKASSVFDLYSMPPAKSLANGASALQSKSTANAEALAAKAGKAGKAGKVGKAGKSLPGPATSKARATPAAAAGQQLTDRLEALLPLCASAEATSVLCTCETSGAVSTSGIVQCSDCLLSCCRACGFRIDLRSHECGNPKGHASCAQGMCRREGILPAEFEQQLRCEAPTTLVLSEASTALLSQRGIGLPLDAEYRLTRVVRERGRWMLGYTASDPDVGTPLAELRVSIGRLGAGRGVSALLFSFAAALKGERGRMPPVARLLLPEGADSSGKPPKSKASPRPTANGALWEVLGADKAGELRLRALSCVPSYRSECGLIDYKAEQWPDELRVDGDDETAGLYLRQGCRFSIVFGALWKRRASDGEAMWFFVRPTVDRTAPDEAVFARSPLYSDCDTHAVLQIVPKVCGRSQDDEQTPFQLFGVLGASGEAGHASKKSKGASGAAAADGVRVKVHRKAWEPLALVFASPHDTTAAEAHEFGCSLSSLPETTTRKLLDAADSARLGMVASGAVGADGWRELKVLTASSTVAERRLAEAVAAPLLRFAAKGGLKAQSAYQELKRMKGDPAWGACKVSAPPRPDEIWTADGTRTYDVEASNAFEQALRLRPSAWDVRVSENNALRVVARPRVAAHRAAEALLRGRSVSEKDVRIDWLIDTQRSTLAAAPMTSFVLPTSKAFSPASTSPPFFRPGKSLYERQARALSRMLAVDAGDVPFEEVEYSDHALSSGVGWTLKVRATRSCPLRGGVLADAVGAGKTINAIALIASRTKEARAGVAKAKDPQHSGATLVVAPVFCLKPVWKQLLDEFTTGLKAVVIEQLADLKTLTVAEIRSADVVIVACELLYNLKEKEPEAYQRHLVQLAKVDDFPSFLEGRKQSRLIGSEPDILTGVWVPNSSQDPFGKSKARQEDRDIAALFTVRYNEALDKLRAKKFDPSTKGVPLEWFTFERLIVDECHESLVLGEDDAERKAASAFVQEKAMQKEKRKCAQREILGIGQPDATRRPFRARRSSWGLTGTPLLSSETRITELAALCGGTYVCGNAAHWRTMERASTRDVFLRYHESASSLIYLEERTKAAQAYIDAAVQRNRIDNELTHIKRGDAFVKCKLTAGSAYEKLLDKKKVLPNFSPAVAEVTDVVWQDLIASLVGVPARQQALRETIQGICTKDDATKVIVFAPAGAAFEAARNALATLHLKGLQRPVLIGDPNDAGCTDAIDEFSRPDIRDPSRPVVLLLSFEYSSALNLQHVSHNIIFYAPLWGDDPSGVHAAANEQQAIGRVVRIGQAHNVVVHRLVAVGPKGQDTIEKRIIERNTSERVTMQAVNT